LQKILHLARLNNAGVLKATDFLIALLNTHFIIIFVTLHVYQ